MKKQTVIVSLHDVAPEKFDLIRRQYDELMQLGVSQMSLLVVPYYHGHKALVEDKALSSWLKQVQDSGHEMVLHGWLHLKLGEQDRIPSFRNWFYDNLYTSREAEFHNLSYEESFQKIGAGLKHFHEVGLNPRGFIAPAWLMNLDVERAAKDHCLVYTNTISEVIHLPSNRRISSRSCVWSTRAAWRRSCSLLWNAALSNILKSKDPLRISLHPSDLEHPNVWAQIKAIILKALETRKPESYRDWVSGMVKI